MFSNEKRYISLIYNKMLQDMTIMPGNKNSAALVKQLLGYLGFNNFWLVQGVGNINIFLYLVRQRLQDRFIQNLGSRLEGSSRATLMY